jgi:hypothetical protein
LVKPRTSGAVLRYCTTEMRSLFTAKTRAEKLSIADGKFVRSAADDVKTLLRFGGFEDAEVDARDNWVGGFGVR